ncbi:type II toxin-antitoxin system VapC family toxin [Plasticicumulans sp.]|uniref:type II toxin-antitoxin system VapC family toxin n=1 Tax=Plasticicumulans sp. TaxID=2307179 RepID=UPI002B79D0EE|nr:type II toxin-antitoxin system VapC family toxin [Pseudomonadota bacterium]HNF67343.1 type II toxin-antitoxin system VapC family toxin [Plasticicumulans sp.]
MKVLLDTHIVLWSLAVPERLSTAARNTIESAEEIYVSSVSIWEISIKSGLGKLDVDVDELLGWLVSLKIVSLPVTWSHARALRELPLHHRDPFDRMLIAQAVTEPLHLLTADVQLKPYSSLVLCQ